MNAISKLNELYRQYDTSKSYYKKRDLKKAIHRLEIKIKQGKTGMKLVGDNLYVQWSENGNNTQ